MAPLLSEFDPERGGGRLWVAIRGDQACRTALVGEMRGAGVVIRDDGRTLTLLMPAADNIDRRLAAVAAHVDRVNAAAGRQRAVVVETRIVAASGERGREAAKARLGDRFWIAPAGGGNAVAEENILLTASGVFGSGLHPSTRLAVRALEELAWTPPFPQRVLDVGTGSGLLALVAIRLGARTALGIDIAPEAVAAARDNAAVNGLGACVRIEATPLPEMTGSFDLILANLTASVQLRLADALLPRLAAGGELIVSGLQGRQEGEMAGFWAERGLEVLAGYAEGKWRALRLRAGL